MIKVPPGLGPAVQEFGVLASGPFVFEKTGIDDDDGDGTVVRVVATNLRYNDETDELYIDLADRASSYVLDSTARTRGDRLTFKSGGRNYLVRSLAADDAEWATPTGAPRSVAEVARDVQAGPIGYEGTPGPQSEHLFLSIADDGEVLELVLSNPSGLYLRDSGGWWKVDDSPDNEPAADDRLDNREWIDVSAAAVDAFDRAQEARKTLKLEDLEKFKVDAPE